MSTAPSNLRIGIVGAGNIGTPLARLWTKAGHTVKIANSRGPETLADVAQQTGATAATVEDAVRDADVVVVTIPQSKVPLLDKKLFSQLSADTIVIDTGNYVRRILTHCTALHTFGHLYIAFPFTSICSVIDCFSIPSEMDR